MDPIQSHSTSDHHQQQQQQQQQDSESMEVRHYTTNYKIPKPKSQDRLSSLPKHLLLHILSFLPTKYAVRTGILSKHWLYLWTSLPVLHFHDPDDPSNHKRPGAMVTIIDRTLFHHDAPKIQKLSISLIYKERYASNVDHWLRLTTRKNIEELELNFIFLPVVERYLLPQFLLKSESLVRLKLMCCKIVPQGRINWKNLESLYVSKAPLTENAIREIMLGCPSLKFLELRDCKGFDNLDINSTSVKELVIDGYASSDESILNISVPYVQSLSILGVMKRIRIVNAPCLIDAKLDYVLWSVDHNIYEQFLRLAEILEKLNYVRDLTLGTFPLQVLSTLEAKETMSSSLVLSFLQSKCKCLTLHTMICKGVPPMVADLLKSSPDVETLIIDMKCPYKGFVIDEFLESDIFDWENCFKCSMLRVKTVKIANFRPRKGEMELVQSLLKNARVLEKMVISLPKVGPQWESSEELREIALKLLSFPRYSSDVVILLS